MAKEVVKTNSDLQDNLNILGNFKQEADLIAANCLSIKIADNTTLAIAQQNLSKANQIVKSIDDKRKTIKQPYLDAGKKIDEFCKTLSSELVKAVDHIKAEVKAWEELKRENERKDQEALAYINGELSNRLKQLCDEAANEEMCSNAIDYISTKFPKDEKFRCYTQQAHDIRDMYLQVLNVKLAGFKNGLVLAATTIEQNIEEVKKRNEQVAELATISAAGTKTRNIRKVWKFELSDINQVPMDWLIIDEAKVKEYLSENKESLVDGNIVKGIKFYKDISVVA